MLVNIFKSLSPQWKRWLKHVSLIVAVAISIFLLLLPFVANSYVLHVMIMIFLFIGLASGLNLVVGYCGQLSFAQGAFASIGAYTCAISMRLFGLSFWIAIVASALVSGLFGLLLGLPTLRLRGDYLGIVTLGFGEIVRLVFLNWTSVTRGPLGLSGIPAPTMFGITLAGRQPFYYLCLVFTLLTVFFFIRRLISSGVGLSMQAVHSDETAAEAIGINPFKFKLIAFVLSSAFAGIVGCIYASYIGFVNPDTFAYNDSLTALAMVTLGGSGSIIGPIVGAILLTSIPEIFRSIVKYRMVIYGLAMVLMMIFRPGGIWGAGRRRINIYRDIARKGKA